jgi:hypothetical protein
MVLACREDGDLVELELPEATAAYQTELARWIDRSQIQPGYSRDEWQEFTRRGVTVAQEGESPLETAVVLMEVSRKGLPGPLLETRLAAEASEVARQEAAAGKIVTCLLSDGLGPVPVGWGAVADLVIDPASGTVISRGPLEPLATSYLHPHGWWTGDRAAFSHDGDARLWLYTGALLAGLSTGALQLAVRYAQQRVQFGRPIAAFQAVQFPLAQAKLRMEGLRLMVLDAAWRTAERNQHFMTATALLAVSSNECSKFISDVCHQTFGAAGLANESGLNELSWAIRWLRHVQHEDRAREFINVTRLPAAGTPRSLVLEGFRPSLDA